MKESSFSINNNEVLLKETFNSQFDVERNGGVVTNVSFENGQAVNSVGYIDYNSLTLSSAWSIRVKFNTTDLSNHNFIFGNLFATGHYTGFVVVDDGSLGIYNEANVSVTTTAGDIVVDTDYEIMVTNDGTGASNIQFYRNGSALEAAKTLTGDFVFRQLLAAGDGTFSLVGTCDLFEIYNYVLTAEEVSNMFSNKRYRELQISSPSGITTLSKSAYSTGTRGHRPHVQYYFRASPLLYYYNNKTYGTWMQRGGVGYGCEPMIYAVDHTTDVVSASYGVGPGRAAGADPHAFPAVIVADDGHIVVAHEQLRNDSSTSGHNSTMEIKRSDNVEDETSWVNAIAHNATFYTTVGDEALETLCYPKLYKLTNGNIILFARCHLEKVRLYVSTDHGVSFNAGNDIVDLSISLAYNFQPKRGTTSQIDMVVTRYNLSSTLRDEVYYLKSVDGGTTWTDVAGGGSKDIVATSALTMAELQADKYRVCVDLVDGAMGVEATMIDANTPYIVVADGTGTTRFYSIYEYSGGTWNEHATGIGQPNVSIDLIYNSRLNALDILGRDISGSDYIFRRYRAFMTDLTSWSILEDNIWVSPTTETYSLNQGHYTFNYVDTFKTIFTRTYDVNASYNDFYIALIESFSGYKEVLHLSANSGVITDRWENTLNLTGMNIFKNG